jgi:hypothetical protein
VHDKEIQLPIISFSIWANDRHQAAEIDIAVHSSTKLSFSEK